MPRTGEVRLTGRPDMTIAVYRGHKATKQQQTCQFHQVHTCQFFCTNLSLGLLQSCLAPERLIAEFDRNGGGAEPNGHPDVDHIWLLQGVAWVYSSIKLARHKQ